MTFKVQGGPRQENVKVRVDRLPRQRKLVYECMEILDAEHEESGVMREKLER